MHKRKVYNPFFDKRESDSEREGRITDQKLAAIERRNELAKKKQDEATVSMNAAIRALVAVNFGSQYYNVLDEAVDAIRARIQEIMRANRFSQDSFVYVASAYIKLMAEHFRKTEGESKNVCRKNSDNAQN